MKNKLDSLKNWWSSKDTYHQSAAINWAFSVAYFLFSLYLIVSAIFFGGGPIMFVSATTLMVAALASIGHSRVDLLAGRVRALEKTNGTSL